MSEDNKYYYYDYVIYHRGCYDGFAGFFILNKTKRIHDKAIVYPDVPSAKDIPPNIENKNVIIIDVAYKREILKGIIDVAKKVTFIDHHDSIRKDVKSLQVSEPHEIIYDENMCGATLVWKYFYGNKNKKKINFPLFLKYISDNDTGKWILKYTKPFMLGLSVNYSAELSYENIVRWKKLFDKKEVIKLIKKGTTYREYHDFLLESNVRKYSMLRFPSEKVFNEFPDMFKKVGQYKVAVYNGGGCPSASSLGERFMEKVDCDFVIMWNYQFDKREYVMALRSGGKEEEEEKIVDVGQIAKIFGGGGHKKASACSFSKFKYEIWDLFTQDVLPRANK
jgi:oligoribonuclease NrnB/cAMP/cGMP phosphodiesterase (DHH superfamily)